MKEICTKLMIFFFVSVLLNSCVSVKKFNERIEQKIAPELLKKDVDFTYQKLQQLHPHLYDYIPKEQLDHKFDSLKQTFNTPLKPNDFYMKLAPVIGEVRQGHLQLRPLAKKLERTERKKLKDQKGLFSRFTYVVENGKLYIKDNPEKIYDIKPKTEILEINSLKTEDLLKRYLPLMTSDGKNTTYHNYALARRWATLYSIEFGLKDSAKIKTRYDDKETEILLKREAKSKEEKKSEKEDKKKNGEKRTKDYNPVTKSFNRSLHFLDNEKKIAYVRIKTFSGTKSRKFYRQTFREISDKNAEFLILDIRDNLGGSLAEIHNLYSYLAEEHFKLINDIEVTHRNSMLYADYFNNIPHILKPFAAVFYPAYLLGGSFAVKKKDGRFVIRNSDAFYPKKPKQNAFEGKIYVLVNGSSFSASSTISSKMKFENRAKIIGEETGGANDATVAGQYATAKLPFSKLKLPIGLMHIETNIKPDGQMRGVFPEVEIKPTLDDITSKNDVQLKWILEHIKAQKN